VCVCVYTYTVLSYLSPSTPLSPVFDSVSNDKPEVYECRAYQILEAQKLSNKFSLLLFKTRKEESLIIIMWLMTLIWNK